MSKMNILYYTIKHGTSQYFPNTSSYSAVVLYAIFPETAGRELLLHYHSEAMDQTLSNSHDITWQEEKAWIFNFNYANLETVFIRRPLTHTCWVIERKAVIDDIIRAHAKGKMTKSSNSVVTVVWKHQRFSDIYHYNCWETFFLRVADQ